MKTRKKLLIISAIAAVVGSVIAGAAMLLMPNTADSTDQKMELKAPVSEIHISSRMGDIQVVRGNSDKITLRYKTDSRTQYTISEENGIFSMEPIPVSDLEIPWYDYYINFGWEYDREIILEIPKDFKADVTLSTAFGDIEAESINGTVVLETQCGDIEVENSSGAVTARTDYGDIDIENISGTLTARTDYGDIEIENISGSEITLDTDYGDISGTISGSAEGYRITAEADCGSSNISGKTDGENSLTARTSFGDIEIKFTK